LIEFFNHHSALILIPGFILAVVALLPIRSWRNRIVLYTLSGGIAFLTILSLQPGNSNVATEIEAQAMINADKPVFIEFFSNSCAACIASQPIVNSLKRDMTDDIELLKLDVQDRISSTLVRTYGVYLTPTFLVISSDGKILWRQSGGLLNKSDALKAIDAA
tara:strand:- start:1351 stop:1836 length:486 start_codon:yes stop_codon:yes gene_type:complete